MSIGSAIFAQLTVNRLNRQTNHTTCDVCSDSPHLALVLGMWTKTLKCLLCKYYAVCNKCAKYQWEVVVNFCSIPDSAGEPESEYVEFCEPRIIPLYDVRCLLSACCCSVLCSSSHSSCTGGLWISFLIRCQSRMSFVVSIVSSWCQFQCQSWIYIAHNHKASNALYTLINWGKKSFQIMP